MSEETKAEAYRRYVEWCKRIGVKPSTQQQYEANVGVVPSHGN